MQISAETVKEFQDAVREEYNQSITEEEARTMLADLVGYFDVLAQIRHQDKLDAGGNQ